LTVKIITNNYSLLRILNTITMNSLQKNIGNNNPNNIMQTPPVKLNNSKKDPPPVKRKPRKSTFSQKTTTYPETTTSPEECDVRSVKQVLFPEEGDVPC
jgi:hypothetical protein